MKIKDTVHFNWYKHLFLVALLAVCIGTSIHVTDADFAEVFGNLDQMTAFMKRFLNPDFSYIPKIVGPMILTIKMSVVGTVAGVILAVPFAFLATTVVTKNSILTGIIRFFSGCDPYHSKPSFSSSSGGCHRYRRIYRSYDHCGIYLRNGVTADL